jgi:hypothetical protein
MDSTYDTTRTGRFGNRPAAPRRAPVDVVAAGPTRASVAQVNSITASQARAARRREARRHEQAVAVWLRELAGPTR